MARPKPVPERTATGDTERIFHDIKQTLRVTGVPLNFRMLAGYKDILPLIWEELRPNLETRDFEESADRIRARAVQVARQRVSGHGQPQILLGESQRYQIQRALKLFHYINAKLLLLSSALKISLHGESIGLTDSASISVPLIARGIPPNMYAMEMATDPPGDERVEHTLEDIKRVLSLPAVNSDYRTLALWPDYVVAAWERLKSFVAMAQHATEELRQLSIHLARNLPFPVGVTLRKIEALGEDPEHVMRTVERFELLLPTLILNHCVLLLDWYEEPELRGSPFPAANREITLREQEAQAV